ncbi:MAG TPA: serine/threonine-protein kinase [Polyangiaceae bacterium]|nr:serine/threonine-protein kinase [Polyangiaceae bacterium]
MSTDPKLPPVYVIESIPVGGDNEVSARDVASEGIPTPPHLRVFEELARGAMGRIHPATDRNLLRHVAMKRLDKDLAKQPFYRDGFIAEGQMTGQLEHPNIVPVHELAIDERGIPYFTMKLVQGVSLARWLHDPARALGTSERVAESLEIFLKVCDAVAYAHYRGVIHRDLKPDNIMVASFGQVYVMDWGLSRLTKTRPASGSQAQMEAFGPVGTPGYMSPEQARGTPADMDERCDVFGLGAVLYEIVSGKTPFGPFRDVDAMLEKTIKGDIVPIDDALGASGVGVAKRLRDIVTRATAPRPKDRYQTVIELQRDVSSFLRGGLHLPRKTFEPGTVIMREGDIGDAAYMIISGKCRAYRDVGDQQETLGFMGTGDVFGEMALLLDEPRAASVEAVDQVNVLVLGKATMTEGLGIGGWTGALVRALASRFRDLEHQVRSSGMRRG